MATMVLSTVGSVIGGALGGPFGAAIGQAIGAYAGSHIDNALFGKTIKNEGPRLSDLTVQVSSYGQAIPRVYGGENRLAGNVIWSTGLVETKTTTKQGGKGAPQPKSQTTSYTYHVSFAIGLCRGPIRGIGRVWADGKLFMDAAGKQKQARAVRLYHGTEEQMPDALMQAAVGVDRCPAHRGLAYIVFEELQLADFGNRMPLFTFEIEGDAGATVGSIAADLCAASGLEPAHYDTGACDKIDVRGYVIARPMSPRGALEPLRAAFFFDVSEVQGELIFAPADAHSVIRVPREDLAAHSFGGERPKDYEGSRASSLELPREVLVQHMDPERDYQTNAQRARRALFDTEPDISVELPIVLAASEGKTIAERMLSSAWLRRDRFTTSLPVRYIGLEPGDKLVLPLDDGRERPVRLVRKTTKLPGIIDAECETDGSIAFSRVAVAATTTVPEQAVLLPGPTFLHLMDLPLLRDEDDGPGFYAAAGSWRPGWIGSVLYRSTDGGTNYDVYADLVDNAVQGTAQTTLSATASPDYLDGASVVTVSLLAQADTLESITEEALLGGGNAALIGDEVVQFRTATLIAPATYELRGFLRGRKGTEEQIPLAAANRRFVLLRSGEVRRVADALGDIGQVRHWKPVSIGETLASTTSVTFTDTGRSLKPYAPVHLAGVRDGAGNLELSWTRRTRLDGSWRDQVDVPLGEESEAYQVDVMSGGTVKRTIAITAPAATYTAAEQAADFGSAQPSVRVRVYQMSARVGRGMPSEKML